MKCNKCGEADAFSSDSWCLACCTHEELGLELRGHWGLTGSRALATDIVTSAVRQVRALRRFGLAGAAAERASSKEGAGISLASSVKPEVSSEAPVPDPRVAAPPRKEVKAETEAEDSGSEYTETEDDEPATPVAPATTAKAKPPEKDKSPVKRRLVAREEKTRERSSEPSASHLSRSGHREDFKKEQRFEEKRSERSYRRRDHSSRHRGEKKEKGLDIVGELITRRDTARWKTLTKGFTTVGLRSFGISPKSPFIRRNGTKESRRGSRRGCFALCSGRRGRRESRRAWMGTAGTCGWHRTGDGVAHFISSDCSRRSLGCSVGERLPCFTQWRPMCPWNAAGKRRRGGHGRFDRGGFRRKLSPLSSGSLRSSSRDPVAAHHAGEVLESWGFQGELFDRGREEGPEVRGSQTKERSQENGKAKSFHRQGTSKREATCSCPTKGQKATHCGDLRRRWRRDWQWSARWRPDRSEGKIAESQGAHDGRTPRSWKGCYSSTRWWKGGLYTLCSGRVEIGGWDSDDSWEGNSSPFGRCGGVKERHWRRLEEEETSFTFRGAVTAGYGSRKPARSPAEVQEEEVSKEERSRVAGEPPVRKEGQERQREEGEEAQQESSGQVQTGPRLSRLRSRGRGRLRGERRRGGPRGGRELFRRGAGLRGAPQEDGAEVPGICDEDAGSSCARAVGSRILGGGGRVEAQCDNRDQTVDLLRPLDPAFLCPQSSSTARTVLPGSDHGSSSKWEVDGGGRRSCSKVRVGPYSPRRRFLGHRRATGEVPSGACAERKHLNDASSKETPKDGAEKPRSRPKWKLAFMGRRTGQRPRIGEREERRCEGKEQRERKGPRKRAVMEQSAEQPMERQQRGSGEEVLSKKRKVDDGLPLGASGQGLVDTVPLLLCRFKGISILNEVLERCLNFAALGRAMLWLVFNLSRLEDDGKGSSTLRATVRGLVKEKVAMHRGRGCRLRSLFPLPLGDLRWLHELALRTTLNEFCEADHRDQDDDVWLALSICAMNGAAGFGLTAASRDWTAGHRMAAMALRASVKRTLAPCVLERSRQDAEKELSSRFMTYTGEEVPKMQKLGFSQVKAALPPASHGGSIDATKLLSLGSRNFLLNPIDALLPNPPLAVKLQSKVHIQQGDELSLCKLLVERNICLWIPAEDIFEIEGQKVLNGLFAVGKGSFLPGTDLEIQRLIMNLVPINSILKQAQGTTRDLVTQYLSVVLGKGEEMVFYQSDMSSAFYLFQIPKQWAPLLSFNISFSATELGMAGSGRYHPACCVIPTGWSSAVAIMQEIADRLTVIGQLPQDHKIRKTTPLPPWLVGVVETATREQKAWYHVYLDNFCAMEIRDGTSASSSLGAAFHQFLEDAWKSEGVLSSEKKKVSEADRVQELGADIDGCSGRFGPSLERLLKLVQTTLVVIAKTRLRKKWVQVVVGCWVHVMSFRRPGMVLLDWVWKYLAASQTSVVLENRVRGELWGCCCAIMVLHTSLRAKVSAVTTASDASMTGGAVGMSDTLEEPGREFANIDRLLPQGALRIPVLVISLFNGVGVPFDVMTFVVLFLKEEFLMNWMRVQIVLRVGDGLGLRYVMMCAVYSMILYSTGGSDFLRYLKYTCGVAFHASTCPPSNLEG